MAENDDRWKQAIAEVQAAREDLNRRMLESATCSICGKKFNSVEDLNESVFVGFDESYKMLSAHNFCYQGGNHVR